MTRSNRSSRSRAHDFSALSTSLGVALTLSIWGGIVAGTLLLGDMRAQWMASAKMEVVLADVPSQEEVKAWNRSLVAETGVAGVGYVDPEQAAMELQDELGEPFMDFLGASPLPAVLELTLEPEWVGDRGWRGVEEAAVRIEAMPGVARVDYPRTLLKRMEQGFDEWTVPGMMLVAVLMAVVFAQITNVVRLSVFGRRFIIRSMELVGAPPGRIRRPFIAEAMGYGLIGALLAYAAVVGVLSFLRPYLLGVLDAWGWSQLGAVLACQVAVGLVLTGLSARWAVGRTLGGRLDQLV